MAVVMLPPRPMFALLGGLYRWLTDNPRWRDSLREASRHFPPSGGALTLLDVGCGHGNSTREFATLRPDIRAFGLDFSPTMLRLAGREPSAADARITWVHGDAAHLPFPDNSIDAITGHSLYYMLPDRAAFLREARRVLRPGGRMILLDPIARPLPVGLLLRVPKEPRYALSIYLWHVYGHFHRRFSLAEMVGILEGAGFERVLTEKAVEGYGVLSRGEKPYTQYSTEQRIHMTAARDTSAPDSPSPNPLTPRPAGELAAALRGKFVFVLVHQRPDKPAWALKPEDTLEWFAAATYPEGAPAAMLAFSSLPKAVEFMQAAVKAGRLTGISKIAKYEKGAAAGWPLHALLNPDLATLADLPLRADVQIDPNRAVTGEE